MMTQERQEEAYAFMATLDGKERAQAHEIQSLFNFHNEQFTDIKEYGTYCDSCVSRVYSRMKDWRNAYKIQKGI
jgi:hypothetical protein